MHCKKELSQIRAKKTPTTSKKKLQCSKKLLIHTVLTKKINAPKFLFHSSKFKDLIVSVRRIVHFVRIVHIVAKEIQCSKVSISLRKILFCEADQCILWQKKFNAPNIIFQCCVLWQKNTKSPKFVFQWAAYCSTNKKLSTLRSLFIVATYCGQKMINAPKFVYQWAAYCGTNKKWSTLQSLFIDATYCGKKLSMLQSLIINNVAYCGRNKVPIRCSTKPFTKLSIFPTKETTGNYLFDFW